MATEESKEKPDIASFFGGLIAPENLPKSSSKPEPNVVEIQPVPGASASFWGGSDSAQSLPAAIQTPNENITVQTEYSRSSKDSGAESPLPESVSSAVAFFERAEELVSEGKFDQAISAYRQGLKIDPVDVIAVNNLAMIYIEHEQFAEALIELEKLCSAGIESIETYNNLGYALRRLGDDLRACDAYEHYLRLNPEAEESQQILNWITGVRASTLCAESDVSSSESKKIPVLEREQAFIVEAERLYDSGDFSGAIAVYNNLLQQNPESGIALEGRGRAEIKDGLLEEGIVSLKEAMALLGASPERDYILGYALRGLGRDLEAAEVYDRFLALEPANENAERIRVWIREVRSRPTEEKEPFSSDTHSVHLISSDETLSCNSSLEKEQPEPTWAATLMEEMEGSGPSLVGKTPTDEEMIRSSSLTPDHSPSQDTGIHLESAESNSPTEVEDLLKEATSLLASGDVSEALVKAQKVVGLDPGSCDGKILIARCFGRNGEFAKAKPILKNILATNDQLSGVWFLLGRCQQELGQSSEAVISLRRVCAMEGDSELGQQAAASLTVIAPPEHGVCSFCLDSFPVASLSEVKGKPTCPACRDKLTQAMGGAMQLEDAEEQVRFSKHSATETQRLRRNQMARRSYFKITLVVLLALFLCVIGLITFIKLQRPDDFYRILEIAGIADDDFEVPAPRKFSRTTSSRTDSSSAQSKQRVVTPDAAKVVVALKRDLKIEGSSLVMGQIPVDLFVQLSPVQAGERAVFSFHFKGVAPEGKAKLDSDRGVIRWVPALGDAGKLFDLVVEYTLPDGNSLKAEHRIHCLPVPLVRPLPVLTDSISLIHGDANFLAAGDLTGDKYAEIVFASGAAFSGNLIAFRCEDLALHLISSIPLTGRPTGLSVLTDSSTMMSGIYIPDWWNSQLLSFQLKENRLELMNKQALTSRPLLMAVNEANGKTGREIAIFSSGNEVSIFELGKSGDLALSQRIHGASGPFSRLYMTDFDGMDGDGQGLELVLVGKGKTRPNVFYSSFKNANKWEHFGVGRGVAQSSVVCRAGSGEGVHQASLHIVMESGQAKIESLYPNKEGLFIQGKGQQISSSIIASIAVDLDGNGLDDLLLLARSHAFLVLQVQPLVFGQPVTVDYPKSCGVPMNLLTKADLNGDNREDVVFLDRGGKFFWISLGSVAGGKE